MKKINKNNLITRLTTGLLTLTLALSLFVSADIFYPEFFAKAAVNNDVLEEIGPGGVYNPIDFIDKSSLADYIPNPTPSPIEVDDGGGSGSSTPTIKTTCVICGHEFYATKKQQMNYDVININGERREISYVEYIDEPSTRICTACRSKYGSTDEVLIENLAAELNQTKSQLQAANASLSTQTQLANSYKATVEEQKTTINNLTAENTQLKNEKTTMQSEISAKSNEIAQLKAKLAQDEEAYEAAIGEEKERLGKEIEELKEQIKEKDATIVSLKTQIEEKDKKINELTAKISSLEEGVVGMNAEINELLLEVEEKKAAIKDLDDRIEAADGDIDALKAEKDELSKEVASKEDLINALNKQVQENQNTIDALNTNLDSLTEEKATLEAEKQAEIDKLNTSIKEYNAELAEKYEKINSLNEKIAKKDGDIDALNEELKKVSEEAIELLKKKDEMIQESTEKILELTSKLNENYVAMNTLKGELATANGGIKKLQDEILRLTAVIDSLNQSNASLRSQLEEQQLYYERLLKNFSDSLQYVVPENNGFTYKNSKNGKYYVCIFGHDCLYDPESGVLRKLSDGTEVMTYKALIDTDYDGEYDKHFWFYIAEDGIHYITFAEDGSINTDTLSKTTVKDLQNLVSGQINSLTAELEKTRAELKELRDGLDTLYEYIKDILKELDIDFDIPDVPDVPDDPDVPDNPTPENPDIVKIQEIMQMVRVLADKYKELEGNYNKVSADYNAIIKAIYGDEGKKGGESDITPEEVIEQLKNEREEAKKKADELKSELNDTKEQLESTEKEMEEAITLLTSTLKEVTGDNEELKNALAEATTLNEQLKIACDQIKALRTSLDVMNSFVKTLATALGLENIEDTAEILAAVNNLKTQVAQLTEDNKKLNDTVASLNAAVQQAYAAGYKAGEASGAGKSESEKIKALNAQIDSLNAELSKISAANSVLTNKNTELEAKIKLLTDENEELTESGKKLTYANNTLKKRVSTLWGAKNTLETKNKKLESTNSALNDKVNSLTTELMNSRRNNSDGDKSDKEENSEDKSKKEITPESMDQHSMFRVSNILGTLSRNGLPDASNIVDENMVLFDMKASYNNSVNSNCLSMSETDMVTRLHANTFITHYFENLDDLAALGFAEAFSLKDDTEHNLSIQAISSFDLIPTEEQQQLIDEGKMVEIEIDSKDLEDGTYLLIHESKDRPDNYDIMLVEVENNTLVIELQDLSPISLAKVSIVKAKADTPEPIVEKTAAVKTGGFKALYLVFGALAVVLLYLVYYFVFRNRSPRKALKK